MRIMHEVHRAQNIDLSENRQLIRLVTLEQSFRLDTRMRFRFTVYPLQTLVLITLDSTQIHKEQIKTPSAIGGRQPWQPVSNEHIITE